MWRRNSDSGRPRSPRSGGTALEAWSHRITIPDSTEPGTVSTGWVSRSGSSSSSAAEADMAGVNFRNDELNGGGKALPCPSNPDNATFRATHFHVPHVPDIHH